VHPLTLPGLESVDADRTGIGLRDHVDAVISVVDQLPDPVVLVGHSGGGAIAHAVVDARPDRVVRAVYVDSGPLAHGSAINEELPVEGGEIPLPDWSSFGEEDLVDLDEGLRERFRSIAVPEPAGVARDPQVLGDERRYDVPVTVIACEYPAEVLRTMMGDGHPYVAELARVHDVELVDLPTGHWPQLTRPRDLAAPSSPPSTAEAAAGTRPVLTGHPSPTTCLSRRPPRTGRGAPGRRRRGRAAGLR
jgi:pimeloyl-ACP methyl ester carboxylesterase